VIFYKDFSINLENTFNIKYFKMESIFSHDLNLCKNILETLNLPNDQLIPITVCATQDFDNIITVYHKDIPWGPTHAQPAMFNHPQIRVIQWFPQAAEPRYELIGNPQAVYLVVRRRLFIKLQHILNRIIQQIEGIYIPASDLRAQLNNSIVSATPILSGTLPTPVQPNFAHTPIAPVTVIPPPPEQFTDADSDSSILYSPKSPPQSSPPAQPDCLPLPREFMHVQTQTEEQLNQGSYFVDFPWAWLDN
jgi:hypothetical protein